MRTSEEELLDNDKSLLMNGMISSTAPEGTIGDELHQPPIHSPSSYWEETPTTHQDIAKQIKQSEKLKQKQKKKERNKQEKPHEGRHFIVLPKGLGQVLGGIDKWEQVLIGGVDDEVSAHTGLFIPQQNLDYEGLVERVKGRILGWCENLREDVESHKTSIIDSRE